MAFESKSLSEVSEWLQQNGFGEDIIDSFAENDMDGEALSLAFATQSGPDCLKDVVPRYGVRLKLYQLVKSAIESSKLQMSDLDSSAIAEVSVSEVAASPISTNPPSEASISSSKLSTTPVRRQKVPDPFPIPVFRVGTELNLKNSRLGDDDRKYIVRVLATMLCTYVQRPSMRDCEVVAKSLLIKYAFLKEHHSWKQFLYTRCQNLNRSQATRTCDSEVHQKRKKIDQSVHNYPSNLCEVEDDTTHERNMNLLKTELSKSSPKPDVIKDIMRRTYGKQRMWILEEPRMVSCICDEYPPLRKAPYILQEFDLIMATEGLYSTFSSSWGKWERAIVDYAVATKQKTQGLKWALRSMTPARESPTNENNPPDESITAFRCIAHFLCKKEKSKAVDDPHVSYLLRESPHGVPEREAIDVNNNYPHIVLFVDRELDMIPRYHIAVEQMLLLECRSFCHCLFCLLAVHYVFNIKYHPRAEEVFTFLLEKVLGIQDESGKQRKKSASYLSMTSAVECYLKA